MTVNALEAAADLFVACRTKAFFEYFVNERRIKRETLDLFRVGYSPPWLSFNVPETLRAPFIACRLLSVRGNKTEVPFGNLYSFPYLGLNGVRGFQFRNVQTDEDEEKRFWHLPIQTKIPFPPGKVERPTFYERPVKGIHMTTTVVEGPIDVLMCHQAKLPHPRGLSGLSINPKDFLLALRNKKVYLMLDWDTEGRRKTFQIAYQYTQMKRPPCALTVIEGPWGHGKDPGDCTEDELKEIHTGYRYTPAQFVNRWISRGLDPLDPYQTKLAQRLLSLRHEPAIIAL